VFADPVALRQALTNLVEKRSSVHVARRRSYGFFQARRWRRCVGRRFVTPEPESRPNTSADLRALLSRRRRALTRRGRHGLGTLDRATPGRGPWGPALAESELGKGTTISLLFPTQS